MSEENDRGQTVGPDDEAIRGQVVDFVNDREIVMSVGKRDGVKVGMQFVVLVPNGVPVEYTIDDETVIENVEVPKAIVKVVRLNGERLSIGRTFMTIKGHPEYEIENPFYAFRHNFMAPPGFDPSQRAKVVPAVPDRLETFDVKREETIRADIDLKVRKGDQVRLTTNDEFIFP